MAARYQIVSKLGRGAFGTVYMARLESDTGVGRPYALKRLRPELAERPQLVADLLDEAQLGVRLDHPNIVSMHPPLPHNGNYWVVMDYVDGFTLKRLMRNGHRTGEGINPTAVCEVGEAVCSALDYAHRASDADGQPLQVVHRDVKPANIMINGSGHVVLMDFGIAKFAGRAHQTEIGVLKGTLAYMAPEQVMGQEVGPKLDMYATAVVLFESLALEPMIRETQTLETLGFIAHGGGLQRLAERADKIPEPVRAVLERALQPNPEERFETCADMAEALERARMDLGPRSLRATSERLYARLRPVLKPLEELPPGIDSNPNAPITVANPEALLPEQASHPSIGTLPPYTGPRNARGPAQLGSPAAETVPPVSQTHIVAISSPEPAGAYTLPVEPRVARSASWLESPSFLACLAFLGLASAVWALLPLPSMMGGEASLVVTADAPMELDGQSFPAGQARIVRQPAVGETLQIQANADGYWPATIPLRRGESWRLELQPQSVLRVRTQPAGGRLWVDDEESARVAPAEVMGLDDGRTHLLVTQQPGGESRAHVFRHRRNGSRDVLLPME